MCILTLPLYDIARFHSQYARAELNPFIDTKNSIDWKVLSTIRLLSTHMRK